MIGDVPYHELSEEEVKARYSNGEFPATNVCGPIGRVITGCWHGRYRSFDAIIIDVQGAQAPD